MFISDKLEPRKLKSYPYRQELRHIANESLGQAVLEFLLSRVGPALAATTSGAPGQRGNDQRAAAGLSFIFFAAFVF